MSFRACCRVVPLLIVTAFLLSSVAAYGSGGFQTVTPIVTAANSVYKDAAFGDFNGDGIPDVAVLDRPNYSESGILHILLGKGDGTFAAPIDFTGVLLGSGDRIGVGDFNHDGKLDVVNAVGSVIAVYLGNGDGTFQSTVTTSGVAGGAFALAVADVNGDGSPDLTVASQNLSTLQMTVWLSNGDGTFHSIQTINDQVFGSQMLLVDVNGDHRPDLVYTSGTTQVPTVRLNNGDGTFGDAVGYPASTSSGASDNQAYTFVGDANGDGKPDLIALLNGYGHGVAVFRGNGDGSFQPAIVTTDNSFANFAGGAVADVNRDGKIDVGLPGIPPGFALGNGDGTFQLPTSLGGPSDYYISRAVLIADVNGDGAPDALLVPALGAPIQLMLNCANRCTAMTMAPVGQPTYGAASMKITVTPSSGTAVPTGKVTLYASDNSGSPPVALTSGALSNGSVTLDFSSLGVGTFRFYATYDGDSNYAANETVVMKVSVLPAPTTTSISVTPSSVAPGQPVTIKTQVSSSGGTPQSGTVTLSDGSTALVVLTLDANGAASYTTSSISAGHHSLSWGYQGSANFAGSTSSTYDLFVGPPDFTVAAASGGSTTQTVTAGQTATYSLSLAPSAGFSGTVTLACSGAPAGATCNVNPSSVSLSGTAAAPFTVSVSTAAHGAAAPGVLGSQAAPPAVGPLGLLLYGVFGTAAMLWFGVRRKRALAYLKPLAMVAVVALLMSSMVILTGCGGGGGTTPQTSTKNPGTPAGTYTVVVTATSGSTTHTQNLTLTVQ